MGTGFGEYEGDFSYIATGLCNFVAYIATGLCDFGWSFANESLETSGSNNDGR